MVSGINTGYYNPYQSGYLLDQTNITPIQYQAPVFTGGVSATDTATVDAKKDNTADGKDDGSIGFWGATKNLLKGAWNFLTSPFKNEKGEWSLKSTLKSIAIGALIVGGNILTGGALTPILLATGAVAGAVGAGKAAYNIATAETDAQAEAAWQSMGSSAATIAATVVGAKGYAKAQAGSAAEAEALANGATAEEAAQAGAQAAARYNGVAGAKNAVGKTFVDSGRNIKASAGKAWDYSTTKFGQVTQAYKDGVLKEKLVAKYDSAVHDAKVYGRYARMKFNQAKTTYNQAREAWKGLTPDEKKAVIADLKQSVAEIAKEHFGSNRAEVIANAKAVATNPENIGIHTYLTRQTFAPDFYDSLSPQEKAFFDSLPKEQREQIEDQYYSMV